jgi:hypothetical protein
MTFRSSAAMVAALLGANAVPDYIGFLIAGRSGPSHNTPLHAKQASPRDSHW